MDTDWTQALTIIITVFGMLLAFVIYLMSRIDSNQKETNAKFEQLLNRMDTNQKESNAKFESMNTRLNAIENRLTAVEVEIKSTNQRLSNIENCIMPRKVFHFEESHKEDPEEPKEN